MDQWWEPGIARLPAANCPRCGHPLDAAGDLEGSGAQPRPGDFTVCLQCTAVLAYLKDRTLRLVRAREVLALDPQTKRDLAEIQRRVRLVTTAPGES